MSVLSGLQISIHFFVGLLGYACACATIKRYWRHYILMSFVGPSVRPPRFDDKSWCRFRIVYGMPWWICTKLLQLVPLGTKVNWLVSGVKDQGATWRMMCPNMLKIPFWEVVFAKSLVCSDWFSPDFWSLVHLGIKMNWLGFEVKRSKFKVPAWPGAQRTEACRAWCWASSYRLTV